MSKNKIIVTGGAGYIGSHTIIELIHEGNFEIISIDNFSNSKPLAIDLIEKVAPEKAFLTHLSHQMGLHEQVSIELPANVEIAYDGLTISL
jgi:UDP-glucose 4-epimerase